MSGKSLVFTVHNVNSQKVVGCECHRVSHGYGEIIKDKAFHIRHKGEEFVIVGVEKAKAECKKIRKQVLNENNILNTKEFHSYIIDIIIGAKK